MASSSSSVPSSSGGKVKIKSLVDNREFEVEKEVLEVSRFLKDMAEDFDYIPIPDVGGDTLEKVLQYSELVYKEKKNTERTKERDESFEKLLLKDSKLFMDVEELAIDLKIDKLGSFLKELLRRERDGGQVGERRGRGKQAAPDDRR